MADLICRERQTTIPERTIKITDKSVNYLTQTVTLAWSTEYENGLGHPDRATFGLEFDLPLEELKEKLVNSGHFGEGVEVIEKPQEEGFQDHSEEATEPKEEEA